MRWQRHGAGLLVALGALVAGCSDPSDTPTTVATAPVTTVAPTTTVASTITLPPTTTVAPTTTVVYVTDGGTVVVANACGVSGAAGELAEHLAGLGFTMEEAIDSGLNVRELKATRVYFDGESPASIEIATSVHDALGLKSRRIFEVGVPAPTRSGGMGDADVLVLLGCDLVE